MTAEAMRYSEHVTPLGLRVYVEEIAAARSAACGFFVATGSRDETPDVMGVSHFLEHMSFKATKKRSAIDVSRALDAMGSRANAYTSWERTVYFAQVLPEFAPGAIELIAEMIDPGFLDDDFATEKNVILEEIEMYNDRPEFLLFEHLMQQRYKDHPLSGRILGTRASIGGLALEKMKAYHADRYRRSNIILAVAGAVKAEEIFRVADRLPPAGLAGAPRSASAISPARGTGGAKVMRAKDMREHYLAAWPGPPTPKMRERYVASVLSILLGDEEGSRFAWALTHKGITEDAEAGAISFRDDGLFYVGFTSAPENHERAREILHAEIARLRKDGLEPGELERAVTKYAARVTLGAESTMSRMSGLGNDALDGVGYYGVQEELEIIMSIADREVMKLVRALEEPLVTAQIGPLA